MTAVGVIERERIVGAGLAGAYSAVLLVHTRCLVVSEKSMRDRRVSKICKAPQLLLPAPRAAIVYGLHDQPVGNTNVCLNICYM